MKHAKGNSEPSGPGRGIMGDVRRIKAGSTATAEELREFIQNFKGRSPHEVLGLVAQSGLTRSVIVATVGCVVLLGLFTVAPYSWDKAFPPEAKAAAPAAAAGGAPAAATETPAADSTSAAPTGATPAGSDGGANAGKPVANEDLLNKLGEGESKTSDPNANPLEESADDLLKDLK